MTTSWYNHRQTEIGRGKMELHWYVLIETSIGMAKKVADQINNCSFGGVTVSHIDTVTGPFDIIIRIEADNRNQLVACIDSITRVTGVERATTCMAVQLF